MKTRARRGLHLYEVPRVPVGGLEVDLCFSDGSQFRGVECSFDDGKIVGAHAVERFVLEAVLELSRGQSGSQQRKKEGSDDPHFHVSWKL